MSKFKAGDRVRRVGNFTGWAPKGFESVVHGKDGDLRYTDVNGDKEVCLIPSDWELIPAGPVREVTRKEIVSGTYGRLRIDAGLTGTVLLGIEDGIDTPQTHWTEKELRAAAATFIELADALATPPREGSEHQMGVAAE
jgi:hypothetical protein